MPMVGYNGLCPSLRADHEAAAVGQHCCGQARDMAPVAFGIVHAHVSK